jgi:hypothetical protein
VALYEVNDEGLTLRPEAAFGALGMYERGDLQRLLRDDISVLGDDLLVIAEEFAGWEDARRRIDLLAVDKTGRLVVIEIKRTAEGGHMDLQAIRYAAMVSSMGFDDVVRAYASHCGEHRADDVDPRAELEAFLDVADGSEDVEISSDVRILLVAADFGREITTTVLWLNGFEGMDIRCVRLVPYDVESLTHRASVSLGLTMARPRCLSGRLSIHSIATGSKASSNGGRACATDMD